MDRIDEDLSAMYLSAKKAHQPRGLTEHEELEMLLESFSKQVEEIVSELETMTVCSFVSRRFVVRANLADEIHTGRRTCRPRKRSLN